MPVLEYTLTGITDPRTLTVSLRTRTLRTVQAAVVLAGTPATEVCAEVVVQRGEPLLQVAVTTQGRTIAVRTYVDSRCWRTALGTALAHKRTVPRVHALMTQVCTSIETLHPGLLGSMCSVAELMYADARRLTIRDRLVVMLRWAAMLKVIPDETRAAASLADLAAGRASPKTLMNAAERLGPGCAGLLATVHEVVALSGGDLDRR